MPMKPDSPFSKLPSVSELLKHPTVQAVVERVNQTTIAQRATGFWDELQASWQEQGAVPTVGELAERLAQRLLGRSEHSTPAVNATGVLLSQRWRAPLSEAAVRELLRFASDYQQPSSQVMERVASALCKQTGAEAAWVASSFAAAISMTARFEDATVASSPLVGLRDPADFGFEHVDTIGDHLQAGADLVVVDGSGMLGGPRCGIVVGKKQLITKLGEHELAEVLTADAMILAALEATLEAYRDAKQATHQIPVLQLMSAPLENLQQRCQRIAPLLATCEQIASAEAIETSSVWLDSGTAELSAPSWQIAIQPTDESPSQLLAKLERANPQIVGRVESTALHLDFRAVFPRWDQHLVAAIEAAG